jgi:hypothetical protein
LHLKKKYRVIFQCVLELFHGIALILSRRFAAEALAQYVLTASIVSTAEDLEEQGLRI